LLLDIPGSCRFKNLVRGHRHHSMVSARPALTLNWGAPLPRATINIELGMPEGDTIWRTATMLRTGLEGKRIVAARPDAFKRLAGSSVTAVEPVGKHLLIRFDSGLALHSHMRMRGAWHLYRRGDRWRRPEW